MKSTKPRRPPAIASGIPVFCKFDKLEHPELLKPHPDNAHREHPAKQLDAYERVIAGTGVVSQWRPVPNAYGQAKRQWLAEGRRRFASIRFHHERPNGEAPRVAGPG